MSTPQIHIPGNLILYVSIMVGLLIVVRIINSLASPRKRKPVKQKVHNQKRPVSNSRMSSSVRPDVEILRTPIEKLNWAEFERLFALYFRSQGYHVEETGVGGNDGGVDLVLTDKRTNERTAVQLKHWSDHRKVGPNVIRELNDSRRNTKPSCHYGMLITSSDVTEQARREADARHITYWHGGVLDMKLAKWSQWQPRSRRGS